jgi:glycosyltransferase involved in cell wall biosynthesis
MTGSTWTEGEGVSRAVKAAVYNRFLPSMGGGERHSCMLAQVLAEEGHEVELVTHEDVGKDLVADHLGLNLAKVSLRVVPDRGDRDVASISADYELFVNASYMSRVKARAAHNVYLCYFPTPFDHDLNGWRRWMVRGMGPYVRHGNGGPSGWGRGWFPPEGGRRRGWTWTSGHAGLLIVGGGERVLGFDLGRPGAPEAAELAVRDQHGHELARLVAGPERFQTEHIVLPASARDREIFFDSDTFVPGRGDDRTLGVAVSRLRTGGQRRTPAEWLGERLPWLNRNPRDLTFLDSYQRVIANSDYTRGWIKRYWRVDSSVLFPPIRVHELKPGPKERKILSVGRFFAPGAGHNKKQLELVEAFGRMMRRSPLHGWELHLVGGCEPSHLPYLEQIRQAATGLPVFIHANAPRLLVDELFASSSLFWHATGFGENEERRPWVFEHFGMTTVEAMAAGCVPVVIDKAGQREIVRHGVDGYRWSGMDELESYTRALAKDDNLRDRLGKNAVLRAAAFSEEAFAARWAGIEKTLGLT